MYNEAVRVFEGTGVNITTEGRKYLGGFIGTIQARRNYVSKLVDKWCKQLKTLSEIAKSEPQAAYAAFVTGFQHKLTYHLRVLPDIEDLLSPLDDVIDSNFIPAISDGHRCSPDERLLLSLPVRLGGLALPIFSKRSRCDYRSSLSTCNQLITNIKQQTVAYVFDKNIAADARKEVVSAKNNAHEELVQQLRAKMTQEQLRAHDLSKMKGASNQLRWRTLFSTSASLLMQLLYAIDGNLSVFLRCVHAGSNTMWTMP